MKPVIYDKGIYFRFLQLVLNYVRKLYKLSRDDFITFMITGSSGISQFNVRCLEESAFCTKEFIRSFQSTCM